MSAPPSVSNLRIIGDNVEGNTIKGVGDYFGGREGPSKYEWMRENKETRSVFVSSHKVFYFLIELFLFSVITNILCVNYFIYVFWGMECFYERVSLVHNSAL